MFNDELNECSWLLNHPPLIHITIIFFFSFTSWCLPRASSWTWTAKKLQRRRWNREETHRRTDIKCSAKCPNLLDLKGNRRRWVVAFQSDTILMWTSEISQGAGLEGWYRWSLSHKFWHYHSMHRSSLDPFTGPSEPLIIWKCTAFIKDTCNIRFLSALQFQLQMFDIVCSLGWTSRDRCCDLPSMVRKDLNRGLRMGLESTNVVAHLG